MTYIRKIMKKIKIGLKIIINKNSTPILEEIPMEIVNLKKLLILQKNLEKMLKEMLKDPIHFKTQNLKIKEKIKIGKK